MHRNVVALALVLVLILAGIAEWGYSDYISPGPAAVTGQTTDIILPQGSGVKAISKVLAAAKVLRHPEVFEAAARLTGAGKKLKAGEYAIPSGASIKDILAMLVAGKTVHHKITLAEGLTSQMIVDQIKADPELRGPTGPTPAEGTLLPETYLFQRGTTRKAIIARMQKAQETLLDKLWPERAPGLVVKTKREAVILASVVEKETALPEERRHIASVFMNRLRIGMRLQSDPTIIYGLTKGVPLGRGLMASEIAKPTPYNTYTVVGLPKGPICNPGRDAIYAVLHPEETNDLYFVANGTGGHTFAATLADHDRNVRHWRHIEHKEKSAIQQSKSSKHHK